jgi:hypothetical protein
MNVTTLMGFAAGVLQFIVAGYALRLNRLFGTKRVGWSLFWAFSLLALLHLLQSVMSGGSGPEYGVKVDVMNTLISMLLLIGMVHLEALLKERVRVDTEQRRMHYELEAEVRKKTAFLTRALEELQAEIDERKRVETEAHTTRMKLTVVSQKVEVAKIASSVLQSVGDILKSVNVSTHLVSDQVRESRIANVVRVGALIREHKSDLAAFVTHDPRGQKLPIYIEQLSQHLDSEQSGLLSELDSIKKNLQKIMLMQQDYAKLAGQTDESGMDTVSPAPSPVNAAKAA